MYVCIHIYIYIGQVQDFGNIYTYINLCPANLKLVQCDGRLLCKCQAL